MIIIMASYAYTHTANTQTVGGVKITVSVKIMTTFLSHRKKRKRILMLSKIQQQFHKLMGVENAMKVVIKRCQQKKKINKL